MKIKEVIVLDNDTPQSQNLISYLKKNYYTATAMNSLAGMDQYMADTECHAVVLNLDNISVTN